MNVPLRGSPANVAGSRRSAAWKTTIASGVSTGALVRMGTSGGVIRTNDLTAEPFFSEP